MRSEHTDARMVAPVATPSSTVSFRHLLSGYGLEVFIRDTGLPHERIVQVAAASGAHGADRQLRLEIG